MFSSRTVKPAAMAWAAEALQQVLALGQQVKQVDPAPGPAGALAHPLVQADHKGRAGVLLRQAGGHNAHHPLVPVLVRQKNDARLGPTLQPLHTLLENLTLNGLPLPVQGAQLLGQGGRAARVPGEEASAARSACPIRPAALIRGARV